MPDPEMTPSPAPTENAPGAPMPEPQPDEQLVAEWENRIKASETVVEDLRTEWRKNVRTYMGKVLPTMPRDHTVNVPYDYGMVELKKSQLVFQVPEVHLKAKNPQSAAAVPTFQAVVNHELGAENADAPTLIDEVATDVLMCAIAASKIGYSADIRTRRVPVMQPAPPGPDGQVPLDPKTGAPVQVQAQQPVQAPDGLMQFDPATGQPAMEPAFADERYVAHEEYFWRRFPIEHLLLPVDFEESNFDRAAWVGMKFIMDFTQAQKAFDLPNDFASTIQTPRETLSSDERPARDGQGANLKQVEGYEIWYQAPVFAPDENPLPKQIKELVLIKGHTKPVRHRNSPYQWIGQDGKLKGMEGFPIHPLTIRFLPGSAYPVSDVSMGRPLSEELSVGRTQMIQFRDRAMPMIWFDRTRLDVDTKAKLDRGEIMGKVGLDGNGNEIVGIVAMPTFPRADYDFNEIITKDLERTWAIRNPIVEPEGRTATEVRDASAVSDVRLDKERTKFLRWFTSGAAKFASLLQQFKDDAGYIEVTGQDGAQTMKAWNRDNIQGEFVFTAKPDSALRLDADVERRQIVNLYNLVGRDPNARRDELLKVVFQRHNLDPTKMTAPTPPPPEPKPEPPKFSFAFKAEDLGNPVVLGILAQFGIEIPGVQSEQKRGQPTPGGPQQQAQHPGAIPQADALNKHALRGDGSAPTVN